MQAGPRTARSGTTPFDGRIDQPSLVPIGSCAEPPLRQPPDQADSSGKWTGQPRTLLRGDRDRAARPEIGWTRRKPSSLDRLPIGQRVAKAVHLSDASEPSPGPVEIRERQLIGGLMRTLARGHLRPVRNAVDDQTLRRAFG